MTDRRFALLMGLWVVIFAAALLTDMPVWLRAAAGTLWALITLALWINSAPPKKDTNDEPPF